MTHPKTSVTHEVTAHLAVAAEPPVPMPAELHFDRRDPYAVRLSVGSTSLGTVDWVFARDLLAQGLHWEAGTGDVVVAPRFDGRVRIVVRTRAGAAALDIDVPAVERFLERTWRVVPLGAEGRHLELDRVVTELLSGSR
ncbi:Sporulation-specific cell division protein SsgB [Streptomyces sp. RB5]|uniref:Sporulation-specific cell division protein SsgB n=1 Tax=Streptomyces smaragdinus TaxID=2585196 RepID=A0A7K0CLB5_9ACTN|nr:SsgA family sporulation/cell division regulator [Streptomyces smaragdinus]MQY14289.1 Sporulation-specific cell division protein SsgB [Streptomyces smaragdinus]